jgi:hypothetical protein
METSTPRHTLGRSLPVLAAGIAALVLSPLLVGIEPIGGDPDRIYRPIKAELANALRQGRLPVWSEVFGLGVPLVAESHAAAFYPPNWLLYGSLDVPVAYRISMFAHNLGLVLATYAYARRLGTNPAGAALSALAFTFCGVEAIHSSHEWSYHVLAFLPLALLLIDLYTATGRRTWLAGLALVLGAQWTLGHFQVQTWTNALVVVTGVWRVVGDRRPWSRGLGVFLAPVWGAAIASVQLALSWELARFVGQTSRAEHELAFYSFPPAHWAELAIPRLFRGLRGGPEDPYWFSQQTTGFEAVLYVGTIPLIFVMVGLLRGVRNRSLDPWWLLVPVSLALATMPQLWPAGYAALLQVPVLGYFRCPARYAIVASFGLALLAGHGFDRTLRWPRFSGGLGLSLVLAFAAFGWGALWTTRPEFRASFETEPLIVRLGPAALVWVAALVVLVAWRRGRLPDAMLLLLTGLELGTLYYTMTTEWGWAVPLPSASPVLSRLAEKPSVGRVGGATGDLPIRAGLTTASPYLGFALPPPHRILESAGDRQLANDPVARRWLRRFGVTHTIWDGPLPVRPGDVVEFRGADLALDRLAYRPPGTPARREWRVVRLPEPFPFARAATRAFTAPDRSSLLDRLGRHDALDEAWYLTGESPRSTGKPWARSAHVERGDGHGALVEHDGTCDLVVARTYYPGWTSQVGTGPEQPVHRVDGGLQAVRLEGPGPSHVRFRYRPTALSVATASSSASVVVALLFVASGLVRWLRSK